jgi:hypothetical protein
MKYARHILIVARWTARVIGTLLLLLIAQFAIGEGVPNPLHGSVAENLLTVAMLTMIVGQILAWKWEGIGGLLILAAFALFAVVNHGVPMNIVFAPWLLTGLLYLGCWWMKARMARIV